MTESSTNMIALSAGGNPEELATHEIGLEQVNELMVHLSRQLLQTSYRLAYGGTLGVPHEKLTELLIDAAVGLRDDTDREGVNSALNIPERSSWPLVNYGAWPYHTWVEEAYKAQLAGVCDFIDVRTPNVPQDDLSKRREQWPNDPIARRYTADSLSEMRERSTSETDLRIVWGGKIRGADGWMPGIAEEVLFSLKYDKPVLILGGFGGCAKILADFLADPTAPWPEALTWETACEDPSYLERIADDTHRNRIANRFAELQSLMTKLQDDLHANKSALSGVRTDLFEQGLRITSASRAVELALTVARS